MTSIYILFTLHSASHINTLTNYSSEINGRARRDVNTVLTVNPRFFKAIAYNICNMSWTIRLSKSTHSSYSSWNKNKHGFINNYIIIICLCVSNDDDSGMYSWIILELKRFGKSSSFNWMGKVLSCSVEGYLQLKSRRNQLEAEGSIGLKKKMQSMKEKAKKVTIKCVESARKGCTGLKRKAKVRQKRPMFCKV